MTNIDRADRSSLKNPVQTHVASMFNHRLVAEPGEKQIKYFHETFKDAENTYSDSLFTPPFFQSFAQE